MYKARKGDGGTYLVVVDGSPEFEVGLRYAARLAEKHRGHIALLRVMEMEDFNDWGNVEAKIRAELRQQAEKSAWEAACRVFDLTGHISGLYIVEGTTKDALLETVRSDPTLVMLILGGSVGNKGPGPLVNYLVSKALGELQLPIVVVPGNANEERIDAIT